MAHQHSASARSSAALADQYGLFNHGTLPRQLPVYKAGPEDDAELSLPHVGARGQVLDFGRFVSEY